MEGPTSSSCRGQLSSLHSGGHLDEFAELDVVHRIQSRAQILHALIRAGHQLVRARRHPERVRVVVQGRGVEGEVMVAGGEDVLEVGQAVREFGARVHRVFRAHELLRAAHVRDRPFGLEELRVVGQRRVLAALV